MAHSTESTQILRFGDFRLDLRAGELKKHGVRIRLQHQSFKVLVLLLTRAGEAVTREEFHSTLWPGDTFVDFDHGLNNTINRLRQVLNDSADSPRFIETLPRRGYRFVGQLEPSEPPSTPAVTFASSNAGPREQSGAPARKTVDGGPVVGPASHRHTVGREKERAELAAAFDSVDANRGYLLCVAGEPGIGKTTLVEGFLAELSASNRACYIARGRCSERLAGTEAYLPFLEALESLAQGKACESVTQTMKLLAPTWYLQIVPRSLEDSSSAGAGAEVIATSQERMKRELAAFFQELSRRQPLVLFLDDLHWTDVSTVDLLAYLATRFGAMRIFIIATYRLSELLLSKHPFLPVKLNLQARGVCREIQLGFLSRKDIETYLALEFPEHGFPSDFPALIHAQTEGSPLFMVDLLGYLRNRKIIAQDQGRWMLAESVLDIRSELPESARSMIQRKIDQLTDTERRLLVAASVQGYNFDSAVLARALGMVPAEVEEHLEILDRVHAFVRAVREQELPDRTLTLRYRFVHILYQGAFYGLLTPTRKVSISAAVAQALLEQYQQQSATVASELALLLEAARDFSRAAEYFFIAAGNAARVSAYQEAVLLAQRGLGLVRMHPESPERALLELMLQTTLGGLLIVTQGGGSPETEKAFTRARELSQQVQDSPQLFTAMRGLSEHYNTCAELETSRELAEQALGLAQRLRDPALIVDAHHALSIPLVYLGELTLAREHLEKGMALYHPEQHGTYSTLYHAIDHGVGCRFQMSRVLWLLGYPDRALEYSYEGIELAEKLSHPYSLAFIHVLTALVHCFRREAEKTQEHAEIAIALSEEHGFPEPLGWGTVWRGWAMAQQGHCEKGIAQMHEGFAAKLAIGTQALRPHLLAMLAETYAKAGEPGKGLEVLQDALAMVCEGGRYYEAELYRLKGELLLMQATREDNLGAGSNDERLLAKVEAAVLADMEACFRRAIDIAHGQNARSFELRAVISRSRLAQQLGNWEEARSLLAATYRWFTEGFGTADLKEAGELLEHLSGSHSTAAVNLPASQPPTGPV